jgi:hypothetical protein
MSEEQEKPKRKWYKKWPFIAAGMVIIAIIISFLVVWVVENQYGTCCGGTPGYAGVRGLIQDAVSAYMSNTSGALPTLSGTYTNDNCSSCHVVNMSALLRTNGGVLRQAPISLNLSASGYDNCGGNASLGCKKGNSYIWIVDTDGSVYSTCVSKDCTTNNSGYQGVWP